MGGAVVERKEKGKYFPERGEFDKLDRRLDVTPLELAKTQEPRSTMNFTDSARTSWIMHRTSLAA